MLRGQVECCDRSRSHELRQRDQAHNWPKRSKPACFLTQKQSTTPGRTPASREIMLPPYLPPSLQPNDIKSDRDPVPAHQGVDPGETEGEPVVRAQA
jgi:hypothetical protein